MLRSTATKHGIGYLWRGNYTGIMPFAEPRLVVFDLDGTLIDSSLDLCNSVNSALEHVHRPTLPNALIASYIGDGAAMLVRRALGDPGDLDAMHPNAGSDDLFRKTFDFFLDYYKVHKLDNTRCYEGVIQALTAIRIKWPELPMAVLTNKPVNPSRQICDALELSPFFFQNYGGNSFESKKPDPTGLLTIIKEASALRPGGRLAAAIAPHEVVMVGDSDVDVLTAKRCGAYSIGCSFGLAPATLAAADPDVTVGHPMEWPAALGL